MKHLRVNNVDPKLLSELKIQAIKSGTTLREYVISILQIAVKKVA
ncbi:MAG TPA: hypothetical protein VN666_21795 [Nitrospira sp.]|nr:hypothetical protein [Nitrospira sp.]